MNGNNGWFLTIHIFIDRYHFISQRRFFTVFPGRICSLSLIFASKEFGQILDFVRQGIAGCFNGTSDTGACEKFIFGKSDNADICRSFNKSFNIRTHFLDTKWNFHQIKQDFFAACRMKNLYRFMTGFCDLNRNVIVASGIFFTKSVLNFGCVCFDSCNIFFGNKNLAETFSGNGIILLSAGKRNNLIVGFSLETIKETAHQYIGVCTFFIDFSTGMTTHQTTDPDLELFAFGICSENRNMADS